MTEVAETPPASAYSEFKLPTFTAAALSIISAFGETLGLKAEFSKFSYALFPGDPMEVIVTFELRRMKDASIVFIFHPRSDGMAEERALDRLDSIHYRRGDQIFVFKYISHACSCPYCRGVKYPFCPATVNGQDFAYMSELERLVAIRNFIGKP